MATEKYHELWYLQVKQEGVLFWLYFLKTSPIQQIKEQLPEIKRGEWSTHDIAISWESFVGNEQTFEYIEEPMKKVWAICEVLQPISKLVFPQWIMDRYKEALDQYIRGEWMSSISLCGDIVEFIVYEFWNGYNEDIPSVRRKTPAKSTEKNLKTLSQSDVTGQNCKILRNEDYVSLLTVRKIRDTHVHYRLRDRLLADYSKHLKSDNVEVLRRLAEFFTEENMVSNYGKYLQYARREQELATEVKK